MQETTILRSDVISVKIMLGTALLKEACFACCV
jgi:hypothetical protein